MFLFLISVFCKQNIDPSYLSQITAISVTESSTRLFGGVIHIVLFLEIAIFYNLEHLRQCILDQHILMPGILT